MSDAPAQFQVQARWMLNATDVPGYANQFLVQPGAPGPNGRPDGYYVVAGHINPPAIEAAPGTTPNVPEGTVFPVVPFARFYCSPDRLVALRDAINDAIALNERDAS